MFQASNYITFNVIIARLGSFVDDKFPDIKKTEKEFARLAIVGFSQTAIMNRLLR
jgi:hypothetical protein